MVQKHILVAAVLGALGVAAAPASIEKRQYAGLTDGNILNFALALEHLEATFYAQAIAKFNASSFTSAGFPNTTYAELQNVAADEASHVTFLTSALSAAGATPVSACNYTFPYTDAKSFLGLSQVLEGVGVSAYLGAASLISNKAYLTAAGSILTAEARHSTLIRSFTGALPVIPYDTPLDPTAVTSLAGPFFASCPNGSAPPFKPFPAATLTTTNASIGAKISVTVANATGTLYCTILSGLSQGVSPFTNGSCTIPTTNVTTGQAYGLITNTAGFTNDSQVIAGPFILEVTNGTSMLGVAAAAAEQGSSSSVSANGASANAVAGISMAIAAVGTALLL